MALDKRMAVTLVSMDGSCQSVIDLARHAEELGYDDLWFSDTGYPDALTMAGVIASHTKLRMGIAVVPVYPRTPIALAATAATIAELSSGRFIMGLGSSSQAMMEGWHGQQMEKPLTKVKETTQLMRSVLAGEKTNFSGSTVHSKGYRQKASAYPVPIYLAGLRPKMVEMAAEVGDGVILNLFPTDALPRIMEHVAQGAERAGKNPQDVEVVCRYQIAVLDETADSMADDARNHREIFRQSFIPYYATPVYNNYLEWAGYSEAARCIREGWSEKDREKTTAAMSDELVDAIGIIGSKEYCQQRIRDDMARGITTPIITASSPDPKVCNATLRAFSKAEFAL
ncbi:MAG: LLM class flavin-dependent oxidoreductase [Pseudomonadales bacterium]